MTPVFIDQALLPEIPTELAREVFKHLEEFLYDSGSILHLESLPWVIVEDPHLVSTPDYITGQAGIHLCRTNWMLLTTVPSVIVVDTCRDLLHVVSEHRLDKEVYTWGYSLLMSMSMVCNRVTFVPDLRPDWAKLRDHLALAVSKGRER